MKFENFEAAKEAGVTHMITVGRRQPMHVAHLDNILDIIKNGFTPIIVVGSTNGALQENGLNNPHFNPVVNPLDFEQQAEQIRTAMTAQGYVEGTDYHIENQLDRYDNGRWSAEIAALGAKYGKAAYHAPNKQKDRRPRRIVAGNGEEKEVLAYDWEVTFPQLGLPVFAFDVGTTQHPEMHASPMRSWDLNKLTDEQRAQLASPDVIIRLANEARSKNQMHSSVPVTMLDISVTRLMEEKGVTAGQINVAIGVNPTLERIAVAIAKLNGEVKREETVPVKIAQASLNQTGGDWPSNLQNILDAIDKAIDDGADILCLEELTLTGYERGDDFFYSDNLKTRQMLQDIADYATSKNPNLAISIGHPWFFADKSIPHEIERLKNPLYNIENQNFNCQSFITGGKIVAMSAKTYLFGYERGYERRHFAQFSVVAANNYKNEHGQGRNGAIWIELPKMQSDDGTVFPSQVIPFGDPVVQMGKGTEAINLYHLICHAKWVGSKFEGQAEDNREYWQDSPLAKRAQEYDIGITVSPSASPPAPNKIDKHYELNALASQVSGVMVDTDGLGSSGSTFAQFGTRLIYQDGKKISEGARCSFKSVAYTSQVVNVPVSKSKGHEPHTVIEHTFTNQHTPPVQDGPAKWENDGRREFEEELRTELLWMRDYMRKNKLPGIAQALSGGADSSYNAAKLPLMVRLECSENGVAGFLEQWSHLKFKDEALQVLKEKGEEAAIEYICNQMLTCVYMGTDNSSLDTLRAAFTLVVGGTKNKDSELYRQIDEQLALLIAGKTSDKKVAEVVTKLLEENASDPDVYKGIGGVFYYRNIQRLVEVYAEIYSGVSPTTIDDVKEIQIRKQLAEILRARPEEISREQLDTRIDLLQTQFEEICGDVLSVAKPEHSIVYENFQARIRAALIHAFANVENKIAIANPNLDEGRNSYATYEGDLHAGGIGGNAHKNKDRQLEHMGMLEGYGLEGLPKIIALHWANKNRPSAELQPKSADGKVTQFDEDQLGRSFKQMDMISYFMLYDRPREQNERKNNPIEVFQKCQKHEFFANDDIETLHDRVLLSYQKWAHAQFKIHASPIAMTFGRNIDKQSSLRTPNISAFHRPELAQLALYSLNEIAKRDGTSFEELTGGQNFGTLMNRALLDEKFASNLTSKMWTPQANDGRKMKVGTLYNHIKEHGFDSIAQPTRMSARLEQIVQHRQTATAGR